MNDPVSAQGYVPPKLPPAVEEGRIDALKRYAILDTDPEPAYDRLVNLAAQLFDVEFALVTLIDVNRQWFKAVCGVDVRETGRDVAFCATTILQEEPLVVPDTLEDDRFNLNPFVTGGAKIRFYAGAPLITPDGFRLGALCVFDDKPRWNIKPEQFEFLKSLAAVVVDQLEMRRISGNVLQEIETRVTVEGDLGLAESQIQQFFQFVPVPVAMLDQDMRYIMASQSWCSTFDLDPARVAGQVHYDLIPGLPEGWKEQHQRCLAGETLIIEKDSAYGSRDGEAWVRRMLTPWRKPDGQIGGIILFNEDITDRVRIEQQLAQSQKMEAIGHLTGGVAHDFNNLMGVVMGNLQLLERRLGDDPSARKLINSALQAVNRGADLTKRLLAFARQEPLKNEIIAINAIVEDARTVIEQALGGGIDLRIRGETPLPMIDVDPSQFGSALLNLAINARDAMPTGGTLALETARTVLPDLISGTATREFVALTVRDSGMGMSETQLKRAFEPFYTTKSAGRGTGLGLSIVFGFMKQSGGHIEIESVEGQGTAVRLLFPAVAAPSDARPAQDAPAPKTPAATASRLTGTALLVDDEPDIRAVAAALLEDMGLTVQTAGDAAAALAILASDQAVDVLITDIMMPGGMDGLRLAERALALRPALPVIFTSGYADPAEVAHDALSVGQDMLRKPYRREELAHKLSTALENVSTSSE